MNNSKINKLLWITLRKILRFIFKENLLNLACRTVILNLSLSRSTLIFCINLRHTYTKKKSISKFTIVFVGIFLITPLLKQDENLGAMTAFYRFLPFFRLIMKIQVRINRRPRREH